MGISCGTGCNLRLSRRCCRPMNWPSTSDRHERELGNLDHMHLVTEETASFISMQRHHLQVVGWMRLSDERTRKKASCFSYQKI